MKKYTQPEFECIMLNTVDIMTGSGSVTGGFPNISGTVSGGSPINPDNGEF